MTKREAAIVSAFTGIMIGKFSDMHKYIEEIMGRSVRFHELGNKCIVNDIKELSRQDFVDIEIED